MSIRHPRRLATTEAGAELSSASLEELREAVFFPQPMPGGGILGISHHTLKPALEAVRVLVRAQGAALFVADENRRVGLHISTLDDSPLVHVSELCAAVARSGCVDSGFVSVASRHVLGDEPAFMAIPLFHEARLAGVLYLEGLTEMSSQSETTVHRCVRILACMLANTLCRPQTARQVTGTGPESR